MEQDTKNVLISKKMSKIMNRKSFLFSILGVFALPAPEKTVKPLDMKDKHHFNIYLHELAHKIISGRNPENVATRWINFLSENSK